MMYIYCPGNLDPVPLLLFLIPSLPLPLSCGSHSAYKWLCSLSLLRVFIHGPYLLSIHMFYIKLANEM